MGNQIVYYGLVMVVFIGSMLLYFKIAKRFAIIDKPNERSSHKAITIRGGGIIFLVAAFAVLLRHYNDFLLPVIGLVVMGSISFLDDIFNLSSLMRVSFHFIAVTLLFHYLKVDSTFALEQIVLLYILVTGILNAYNFMDGINGITGVYSLVILGCLQWINLCQIDFLPADTLWLPMLACLVFLFFNFRKKAVCFAGDVGSMTIAFWILILLFSLILATGNYSYFLFLSVYGVDAVLTIMHRLLRKENIFVAHRLHFYQLLANEQQLPHRTVSLLYGGIQLLINIWIMFSGWSFFQNFLVTCLPLIICYIVLKPRMMVK